MPSQRFARVLLLLTVLSTLPALAAGFRWTIQGPDAGAIDHITFDPVDPSIAYATGDTGLFRSTDGGQHWVAAAELFGKSVENVAVAAGDPQKVFAASVYGLFGSVDRGVTWRVVHGFASFYVAVSHDGSVLYSAAGAGPARSSDGGVTFGSSGTGLPPDSVTAIVLDPQNPNTVYASLLSNGVYKSVDGGATWTAANSGLTAPFHYSLVIDPSNSATLYLASAGAIYKTTNGGSSWSALITSVYCYSIAVSPTAPSTIIAAVNLGVLKSTNGGSSWAAPTLTTARAAAIDPKNPANVLIGANWNLFRSNDGGGSYALSTSGLTAHYTYSIVVDPRNASVVYASGPAGVFKSTDRGRSWSPTGSSPISPTGFPTSALVVDPFDSSVLYGITSATPIRSLDGGVNWHFILNGLNGASVALAADSQTAGTLYAIAGDAIYRKIGNAPWVARGTNGLPAGFQAQFLTLDRSTVYTGGAAGLFKSVDGAGSWTAIRDTTVSGVAVDPYDANHLFTWSNAGLYESTNGGTSWSTFAGLPANSTIVFDATAPGRIYARNFASVKLSTNAGQTWASLGAADGLIDSSILAIAPDGKTLYIGGSRSGVWTFDFGRRRAARH